jgi:ABC-type polysaccharide/polyol phosphate transport system ATPase subunit
MKDDGNTRVELNNICKKFDIDFKSNDAALSRLIDFMSSKRKKRELNALKDISFKASAGETIGIIGDNGSGKSTLLRIIAEVYTPTSGVVRTNGNVVYLTTIGLGLMPKLTMRENIKLMGSIMGLSQKDIRDRFDEIVEFSGLKEFLDTKVYQFSSGMTGRLGFSATIHCISHRNPDILLLDEVLGGGVGDIDFQAKALKKMEELITGGATVIMVSHGLASIDNYCDNVIWLEKGEIVKIGNPKEVIKAYTESRANPKVTLSA